MGESNFTDDFKWEAVAQITQRSYPVPERSLYVITQRGLLTVEIRLNAVAAFFSE